MDSNSSLIPARTAVVRSHHGQVSIGLPHAQPAHRVPDAAVTYTEAGSTGPHVPAAWLFTPITASWFSSAAKRVMDLLGGVAGLVVSAPVWIIAAVAIRSESRGPILFRQTRVGKDGRLFCMLKFRTMCADAEIRKADLAPHNQMSGPVFKMNNDPRVTRLGRFLRKYSIDELPQLINVLRGEMSLVGPRPALPSEVSQYETWQCQRLCVRPGLTCLWQVNGRNSLNFEEWMRLDLEYITKSSLHLDLWILARTVPAVLRGTGV